LSSIGPRKPRSRRGSTRGKNAVGKTLRKARFKTQSRISPRDRIRDLRRALLCYRGPITVDGARRKAAGRRRYDRGRDGEEVFEVKVAPQNPSSIDRGRPAPAGAFLSRHVGLSEVLVLAAVSGGMGTNPGVAHLPRWNKSRERQGPRNDGARVRLPPHCSAPARGVAAVSASHRRETSTQIFFFFFPGGPKPTRSLAHEPKSGRAIDSQRKRNRARDMPGGGRDISTINCRATDRAAL